MVALAFDRNEMIAPCATIEPACPNALQFDSSGFYFFQMASLLCGIGRYTSRLYGHIFFTAKSDKLLLFEARFRAEDKFILLSSPRVTGPTNYDEDF